MEQELRLAELVNATTQNKESQLCWFPASDSHFCVTVRVSNRMVSKLGPLLFDSLQSLLQSLKSDLTH